MNRIDLSQALDALRKADSILISTHKGPDGDAVGSVLGLYHLLKALHGPRVTVVCQDPVPRMYEWLAAADAIVPADRLSEPYDLAVITDVAQLDRLGNIAEYVRRCNEVLVLDHHLEEDPDGTLHYIDATYAAASEIIVDLFEVANVTLTREAAECLYVGLVTDTGGFRFSNTNAAAHRRAARLVETGIDVAAISNRVFDTMSHAKLELLKRALDRLRIIENGAVAYSYLTQEDMASTQGHDEDIEGIVNYVRNVEGVQVGVLFRDINNGKQVKVSMRSGDEFNSAEVLQTFGGGGHKAAAGAVLPAPRASAIESVLQAVHDSLAGAVA